MFYDGNSVFTGVEGQVPSGNRRKLNFSSENDQFLANFGSSQAIWKAENRDF